MPSLTIRDIDPEVKLALRRKAARNNRSMEAEVRAMLQRYCLQDGVAEEHLVYRIRRLAEEGGGLDLPADKLRDKSTGLDRTPDFGSEDE